ncbi:hypothetical protein L9F63_023986, partial [Diploptera punctata]
SIQTYNKTNEMSAELSALRNGRLYLHNKHGLSPRVSVMLEVGQYALATSNWSISATSYATGTERHVSIVEDAARARTKTAKYLQNDLQMASAIRDASNECCSNVRHPGGWSPIPKLCLKSSSS